MSNFDKVINMVIEGLRASKIRFDRKDGIGAVPFQQNINYYGFTKMMTPKYFRSLVPKGVSGKDTFDRLSSIKGEVVLAPPFLQARWNDENKVWQVIDHEGRSRTDFCIANGVDLIPVDIFPRDGMRSRDITDEMKEAPFIPQK